MVGLYYAAAMPTELPDECDCRQLAHETGRLAGTIAGGRLQRIGPPYRLVGSVDVALRFAPDGRRGIVITGDLVAPMEAQCQRCLAWMPLPLRAQVEVVAVEQSGDHGDEDRDYIEITEGRLQVLVLVEDELLLSCPLAPVHEHGDCADRDLLAAGRTEPPQRAFAGLADLLKPRS
jgi:uncharacterized protein